jgi:hypothetical protein
MLVLPSCKRSLAFFRDNCMFGFLLSSGWCSSHFCTCRVAAFHASNVSSHSRPRHQCFFSPCPAFVKGGILAIFAPFLLFFLIDHAWMGAFFLARDLVLILTGALSFFSLGPPFATLCWSFISRLIQYCYLEHAGRADWCGDNTNCEKSESVFCRRCRLKKWVDGTVDGKTDIT